MVEHPDIGIIKKSNAENELDMSEDFKKEAVGDKLLGFLKNVKSGELNSSNIFAKTKEIWELNNVMDIHSEIVRLNASAADAIDSTLVEVDSSEMNQKNFSDKRLIDTDMKVYVCAVLSTPTFSVLELKFRPSGSDENEKGKILSFYTDSIYGLENSGKCFYVSLNTIWRSIEVENQGKTKTTTIFDCFVSNYVEVDPFSIESETQDEVSCEFTSILDPLRFL